MTKVKTSLGVVEVKELSTQAAMQTFDNMKKIAEQHSVMNLQDVLLLMLGSMTESVGDAVKLPDGVTFGALRFSETVHVVEAFINENPSFFDKMRSISVATRVVTLWLDSLIPAKETTTTLSDSSVDSPNSDTPTS